MLLYDAVDLKQTAGYFSGGGGKGLFRISRELQFRVCNHGEPCASPLMQGKETTSIERKKKLGGL